MGVAVGDVTRCVAKMLDADNSLIMNTYFIHNSGLATVDEFDLLVAVEAALSAAYLYMEDRMPSTLTTLEIECDAVRFEAGRLITVRPIGTAPWVTWDGGTSVGTPLPSFVAVSAMFPTVIPRVQGRKSLGPLSIGAIEGNNLTSGTFLDVANYAYNMNDVVLVDGNDFDWGIMSTKAAQFVLFTGWSVSPIVGHMNTRKAGVGV